MCREKEEEEKEIMPYNSNFFVHSICILFFLSLFFVYVRKMRSMNEL